MEHATCAQCGTSFEPSRFAPVHRFCSEPCRERAGQETAPPRICEYCLRPYHGRDKRRRFCSASHGHRARSVGASCTLVGRSCLLPPLIDCEECRRPMHQRNNATLCSEECRRQRHRRKIRERWRARQAEPTLATCAECGSGFVTQSRGERWRSRRTFCTDRCATRAGSRQAKHLRRSRSRSGETIRRARVLERDGWTCGLCHTPIARDHVVPHPKAPTLDHIIPLADGGTHTYWNVQAAHFACNVAKGVGDGQLRLALGA